MLCNEGPISIQYTSKSTPSGRSVAEVQQSFSDYQRVWLQSSTCESLVASFQEATISVPITKIIGFGLGRIDVPDMLTDTDNEHGARRCNVQHAAMLTLAAECRRAQSTAESPAPEILCYVQDPAYTDVEKEVLTSNGLIPVDDPKGFLEIDANTLVISIHPNVPVRQIVADVQWPAAMIWNDVKDETEEENDWTCSQRDGHPTWVS